MKDFNIENFSYRPVTIPKSPRIVPGSDLAGSVAPSILRPTVITFKPSQTYNHKYMKIK